MAQKYTEVRVPFNKMTFSPDVPSSALAPNEYNAGYNVESDIRGIRSVQGDEAILGAIPGTVVYVTSGYRANNVFWFIAANSLGQWFAQTAVGLVVNITPGYDEITNPTAALGPYPAGTAITDAWNGNVLFINDSLNPPMYLPANDTQFIQYSNDPTPVDPDAYIWNYNPNWSSLTAGFMRMWATPNVGSILIAGNLTAVQALTSIEEYYPTTVQWSQAFGLNDGPTTWAPTIENIANQLEIPVRGPVIDGFPCGSNFFLCSYWDTVIFSPINYQSSAAPVIGCALFNVGRGLLNSNCWANADRIVYGLDARDIWAFDGQQFKSLGNQRVKNYFYANLNPSYSDRVFIINNTAKNQIEIYYPDLTSTGFCNKMLSYRYDLDSFNPPRSVTNASMACESPIWDYVGNTWQDNDASRTVVYSNAAGNVQLVQKDLGTTFIGNTAIASEFQRDNIQLLPNYSQQLLVHRILPEAVNVDEDDLPISGVGNITITVGGADSVGTAPTFLPSVTIPINTDNPWTQINQNAYRINTVKISDTSSTASWLVSGITWQYTPTQDSR